MRRRDFITLLGGAVLWSFSARAQQPPMPVIGFLNSGFPAERASLVAAFRQGLKETGYVEGQSVAIEYRFAEGHYDRLTLLASDLVHRQVAVIAATAHARNVAARPIEADDKSLLYRVATDWSGTGHRHEPGCPRG
jgi:putative ABC transport system substrate-binding protein